MEAVRPGPWQFPSLTAKWTSSHGDLGGLQDGLKRSTGSVCPLSVCEELQTLKLKKTPAQVLGGVCGWQDKAVTCVPTLQAPSPSQVVIRKPNYLHHYF